MVAARPDLGGPKAVLPSAKPTVSDGLSDGPNVSNYPTRRLPPARTRSRAVSETDWIADEPQNFTREVPRDLGDELLGGSCHRHPPYLKLERNLELQQNSGRSRLGKPFVE